VSVRIEGLNRYLYGWYLVRNMKRMVFFLSLTCISVLVCEVGLHGLYLLTKGRFIWAREQFIVRDFTQRVNDERYITGKPRYRNASYTDGTAPWQIELDSHGFRMGLNTLSEEHANVVFIGDSVPFGYGVNNSDTVPSLLQERLQRAHYRRGVINAALPSYSLDQAVHRYKYELAGRYKIEAVILQIYDPATQFAQLGRGWDVTKNWTTSPVWERWLPVLQYSSLWHVTYHYMLPIVGYAPERLKPSDEMATKKYIDSINASLQMLINETRGEVKTIFILPATLPPKTWRQSSEPQRFALTMLNQTLQAFARKHSKTRFVDTNALFASDEDGRNFIDECCHLSHEGATRLAGVLADLLLAPN